MARIIPFEEKYRDDFIRLNTEWIETYFRIEESDRKTFAHVDDIIKGGGQIFIALDDDGRAIGCCALVNHPDKQKYELAKMAVSPSAQDHHVGRALGEALMRHAREIGVKRIFLEGNTRLAPSIALYRSLGFHETELQGNAYERCDIIMEAEP